MGVSNFCILYDNPTTIYFPGQMVTGKISFILDSRQTIRAIDLKVKGVAKVSWKESETYHDNESNESRTREVERKGKQEYFCNKQNLLSGTGTVDLYPGQYMYPFSTSIPASLPSSFHGEFGQVKYCVKAELDISMGFDKKAKAEFKVENPLNLNNNPALKESVKKEVDKSFCCLCCANGPLTMTVIVPFTGYVPGQKIPVTVEVDNVSNVNVGAVKWYLIQRIKWVADSDTKWTENILVTRKLGEVPNGSNKIWSEHLEVPFTPVPNLTGCKIIIMTHILKVECDPDGAHTDLEVHIPIEIGGIQLQDETFPQIAICPQYPPPPSYPSEPPFNGQLPPPPGPVNPTAFNPSFPIQQPIMPSAPIPYSSQTPPQLPPPSTDSSLNGNNSIYPNLSSS